MGPRVKPIIASVIGVAVGIFALSQTAPMSELGRVFPTTAGIIAIVGGVALAALTVLRPVPAASLSEPSDVPRVIATCAVLLGWALLLDPLGFIASSGLSIVALALIARREPMGLKSIAIHLAVGAGLVLLFAFLLSQVLNVSLP
ncbi:tripartite tricarboxylate transporter TctB family protein [Pseudaestuariivita rosea]|uniref:tripartite tricarboxylate transporter TctB family protein n=1 Tax=Pseudaestuariivita rosea TaxID=2763263 RepID=UPI001ABAE635|nr:tripartite tricarboxylate transporter TctB family protein [Pseudaestuariivita rosea]